MPLDAPDRRDQHRTLGLGHRRIDGQPHEIEPGRMDIGQRLVTQVTGQHYRIATGREAEPAGDVDASGQGDNVRRRSGGPPTGRKQPGQRPERQPPTPPTEAFTALGTQRSAR
jgi:hypothetical protein